MPRLPAKNRVVMTYPKAAGHRIEDGRYVIWSDGYGQGVLLAHGRTRAEAWEKALFRLPPPGAAQPERKQ